MKRLILAIVLLCVGFVPALAATDYVHVRYNGEQFQFKNIDLDTMMICALKQQVSAKLGLEIRKFHLTQGGGPLDDDKTLSELYLGRGSVLRIKEVPSSNQCR